jgi:hypothetical protein
MLLSGVAAILMALTYFNASGQLSVACFVVSFAVFWSMTVAGGWLSRVLGLSDQDVALRFTLGYFGVSLFLLLCALLPVGNTAVGALVVMVASVLGLRRGAAGERAGVSALSLPALLAFSGSVAGVSLLLVAPHGESVMPGIESLGRWFGTDAYYHPTYLSMFARARGFRDLHHTFSADWPLPFYHYVNYLVPSAIVRLSGVSAYFFWAQPMYALGYLLAACGAFSLLRLFLAPQQAAFTAFLAIALQPARFLSYSDAWHFQEWMLLVPAYGSSLGGVCLFLRFLRESSEQRGRLWAVAFMGFSILMTKAHFVLVLAPVAALYLLLYLRFDRRLKVALVAAGVAAIPVSRLVAARLETAPEITFSLEAAKHSWRVIRFVLPDTAWLEGMYQSAPLATLTVLSVLVVTGGVGLIVLVASAATARREERPWLFILIASLGVFLVLSLFAEAGDHMWEVRQRPFVLTRFLLGVIGYGLLAKWLGERALRSRGARRAAVACVLTLVAVVSFDHRQDPRVNPDGDWVRVLPSTLEAGQYVQARAREREMIAVMPRRWAQGYVITSSSGMRPFLNIRDVKHWKSHYEAASRRKIEQLNSLLAADTPEKLRGGLQETGIRWFVVDSKLPKAWPKELTASATRLENLEIYHFQP